jgi:MraZ protein
MLRGNHTARIDDKGRLKVPTPFRQFIEAKHGTEFFVTSLTGENVWIYPLPEWEAIEQRLMILPSMDTTRRKFIERTNFFGQQTIMDAQGRILIHSLLRRSAELVGDVVVLGNTNYLEVWEFEKFQQKLLNEPFTEEDISSLGRVGI